MFEIELYFGGEDPHMEIHAADFTTGTELANFAYAQAKKLGAIAVSFGPAVTRDVETLLPV